MRTGARDVTLFGLGFLGAALLAACIVPLSTAYSVAEAARRPADTNDSFAKPGLFYVSYGGMVLLAAAIMLIPGAPLVSICFSPRRSTPSCCS
jgi:Mn2+/Fe2+ NRAMP family transporter